MLHSLENPIQRQAPVINQDPVIPTILEGDEEGLDEEETTGVSSSSAPGNNGSNPGLSTTVDTGIDGAPVLEATTMVSDQTQVDYQDPLPGT